jgi:ureidoglycolate lyase
LRDGCADARDHGVEFLPYGWLAIADGQAARTINEGTTERVDDVGELALTAEGGAPCLALFRAQARDPRGPWQRLERHRLGTQTFVPLGGVRYVVLVATGRASPEASTLAAFVVAGTWHHGLIALERGDFVIVERKAASVDCDVVELPEPVTLEWTR